MYRQLAHRPRNTLAELTLDRRSFGNLVGSFGLGVVTLSTNFKSTFAASDEPSIFTWSGYDADGLYEEYVEQFGQKPNITFFSSEEDAFAKLQAGFDTDVVSLCEENVPRWRDTGLIQPIDTANLTHWNDILKPLKKIGEASSDGQQWLVPSEWGMLSIAYRTDLVSIDEPSWDILWRDEYAYKVPALTGSTALSITV